MCDPNKVVRLAKVAFLTGIWIVSPLLAAPADPAKDYPNKPIRFIVPAVAGGANDITTRAIAQKLAEAWGRQVIVDNRGGASGAIAVEATVKAIPDGGQTGEALVPSKDSWREAMAIRA